MAVVGRCSIPLFMPEEVVPGIMFVSGYIMSFNKDGTKGIMSVRGGGNRFVVFSKNDFYINGQGLHPKKRLFDALQAGNLINVIMKDLGKHHMISTFQVRFQGVLCWIGSFPSVPPFVARYPQLCSNTTANETTPPLNIYDIVSDVPIRELEERSGLVYWCCEQYGLISVKQKGNRIDNVLFTPCVLFLNGIKFPRGENFALVCSDIYFSMYAKKIPLQKVFGVNVTSEAVLVWRGKKPSIRLVQGIALHKTLPTPLQYRPPTQPDNRQVEGNGPALNGQNGQNELPERGGLPNNTGCHTAIPNKERMVSAIYLTGTYQGIYNGCLLYGSPDKATRFTIENFYANGEQFSSMVEIGSYIMRSNTKPTLHGYVIPLKRNCSYGKFTVVAEALYVWHGPAPVSLKEKIKALRREPADGQCSQSTAHVTVQRTEEENMVDRADLVGSESISIARPIKRGRVSGYVLTCSSADAVLTGFTNTVHFTRERFYVHGRKFRGTSLLDFFQKNDEKVYTYLVPMKTTKIRGCVVFSKAVCAWIGKEPEELQKLIYNDKKITNYEVNDGERKEEGCFYYFVGRVKKMGEKQGVMQCDVEGEHVDVSFSVSELYKHGKKINDKGILALHMKILMTSRWSVLASYSPTPTLPGVHYTAAAVWHHENQGLLFDEFQNKIPHWQRKLNTEKCVCAAPLEKLLKKPYSSIARGSVTEKNCEEIAVGVKDRGLVWLSRHRIWVDGCSCYFSNSDENRVCNVVFGDDDETPLFAWMGKEPQINKGNRSANYSGPNSSADIESDSDDDDRGHDDEKYFEDVYEETDSEDSSSDSDSSVDLTDVADPYELIRITTKNSFAPLMRPKTLRSKKKVTSTQRNFCGRHVVGQILSVSNDCAIASWRSVELSGTIFIVVDVNYLFINCVAYSKGQFGEHAWKGRTCNLYINTLRDPEMYGLLEASARATVAWIGTKPVFAPPPGKQKLGTFLTSKIRIAYSDSSEERLKFCSLDHWKKRLEWEHEKQKLTSEHELKLLEQENRLLKETGLKRENKTASIGAMLRPSGQNPPVVTVTNDMSRLYVAEPALKVSSKQVLDTMCPSAPIVATPPPTDRHPSPVVPERQPSPAVEATTPCQTKGLTGRVVELHANLGRLLGPNSEPHYFRPDQFLLHGVSLAGVELYYVLVQDLPVQYSVDGEGRLDRAWHGSPASTQEDAALLILAWCETNLVPDDTRAVLLSSVSRL